MKLAWTVESPVSDGSKTQLSQSCGSSGVAMRSSSRYIQAKWVSPWGAGPTDGILSQLNSKLEPGLSNSGLWYITPPENSVATCKRPPTRREATTVACRSIINSLGRRGRARLLSVRSYDGRRPANAKRSIALPRGSSFSPALGIGTAAAVKVTRSSTCSPRGAAAASASPRRSSRPRSRRTSSKRRNSRAPRRCQILPPSLPPANVYSSRRRSPPPL